MITLVRAKDRHSERHHRHLVWLTFRPRDRGNPRADHFGPLESLSEKLLAPSAIASRTLHHDAEIVTYVREGALTYEDSPGCSGVIRAGEFQVTIAGYGTRRSETNASRSNGARVFQFLLASPAPGLEPGEEQRRLTAAQRRGGLCAVASADARRGLLHLHQDSLIYSALLDPGQHVVHELSPGRIAWLHLVDGEVTLGEIVLSSGDGAGVTAEHAVSLTARAETEILLVDLGEDLSKSRRRMVRGS